MAETWPYVKQTWTDGVHSASGARLTVIEEGIRAAHLQPAVRVFDSANQSIATSTPTILAFNSERFDQAGGAAATHHDTVTNNSRLTCLYAGVYQITAFVRWAANTTGTRDMRLLLNGATSIGFNLVDIDSSTVHTQNVTTLYALAVSDYVQVQVNQSSGGALNVEAAANYSPEFMMVRVA